MQQPIYEAPPFPRLFWSNFGWEGEVLLAAYGTMTVQVAAADPSTTPTAAQARAFTRLVEHNEAMDDEVIRAILEEYPAYRAAYQDFDPENADEVVPPISSADELERLIDLGAVYVLDDEVEGEAFVGFLFDCPWDPEHGLGVMTHAGRVIEVGGADSALCSPAKAEAPRAVARPPAHPPRNADPSPRAQPRRWWEFWKRG